MNQIGTIIKERRLVKGLSARALAEKARISHSEVHRIENGERKNPSIPVLNSLADALGIPKDDMLMLAGYKQNNSNKTMLEQAFPDLKTEKQQKTARMIIDRMCNSDLSEDNYDALVEQVEMFVNYRKQ